MKFLNLLVAAILLVVLSGITACNGDEPKKEGACPGVDCGDDCLACHCYNGVKDENELCVDCGGPCEDCEIPTGRYADVVFPDLASMSATATILLGTEVVYSSNEFPSGLTKDLTITFFDPAGDETGDRPIVMMLGGTGYGTVLSHYSADDNMAFITDHNYIADFLGKGYLVAMVETRHHDLGNNPSLDEMYNITIKARADLLSAIRFIRKEANTYHVDTDNIWLMGYSGGAVVALHAALLGEDNLDDMTEGMKSIVNANGGIEGDSGNDGFSSSIKGVINMAGFLFENTYVDGNDEVLILSLMPENYDNNRFALDCEMIGSDYFDDTYEACGPSSFEDLIDHEVKILPGINQWALIEPGNCPDCPDMITDYIARRLGACD